MTSEQITFALRQIADAIVEAVKGYGVQGMPGGQLYAVLMSKGCTLSQFEALMSGIVAAGKLRKSGQLYYSV